MTSHGLNVSIERLETLFWTSRLGLVSDWWHWRLGLVSVSASYVSFTTLQCTQTHTLNKNKWKSPVSKQPTP